MEIERVNNEDIEDVDILEEVDIIEDVDILADVGRTDDQPVNVKADVKQNTQSFLEKQGIQLNDHDDERFMTTARHQFFEGAERGQILDVLPLLHLEDKNCVLIEAEPGYGKTSLAQQIHLQTLEYAQSVSLMQGAELASNESINLSQAIARRLELDPKSIATVRDAQDIARLYSEQHQDRLVFVIDNAHHMSSQALTLCCALLKALPKNQVQLVLLTVPNAPVLIADSAFQDYLKESGHQVSLRALNTRETNDYVRFMLVASEQEKVRLSRQALNRIFQTSAGVPSKVNEALVYALQEYDQQPHNNEKIRSEAVPKWHLISLSLVAVGVLALILFGNPEQKGEPRFSETIAQMPESDKNNTPPILFTDATAPKPLAREQSRSGQVTQQLGTQGSLTYEQVNNLSQQSRNNLNANADPNANPNVTVNRQATPSQTLERVTTSDGQVAQRPAAPSSALTQEKISMDSKLAKLAAANDQALPPTKSATAPVESTRVQPKQVATTLNANTSAGTSANTSASAGTSANTSASAGTSTNTSASADAAWVKSMQPSHFTLQLLGGANKGAIQDFIVKNGSLRKMGYFETKHDGRPWYVVVYGDFPSRAQAMVAAGDLPSHLRASQPWPRSAADVQAAMR